jgi:hypothetical protein
VLVDGIVRRPDPVPCPPCGAGEWDMCRNGRFTEHGIKGLHGFARERWRAEPGELVRLGPEAARVGVMVEPSWLSRLPTRIVPLDDFREAFERRDEDVKVVVDLRAGGLKPGSAGPGLKPGSAGRNRVRARKTRCPEDIAEAVPEDQSRHVAGRPCGRGSRTGGPRASLHPDRHQPES